MDRSKIINALKSTVQSWYREDPNRVTVRAARTHVENELNLGQGFLENEDWKAEAKRIVKEEFAALNEELEEREGEKEKSIVAKKPTAGTTKKQIAPSKKSAVKSIQIAGVVDEECENVAIEDKAQAAPKKTRGRPSTKKATEKETTKKSSVKRGRAAAATPKKLAPKGSRAKPTIKDEEDGQEPEMHTPSMPSLPLISVAADSESELSDPPNETPPKELKKRARPGVQATAVKDEESDSELPELLDEPPKKKGKRTLSAKANSPKKKAKPPPTPAKIIEAGNDFKTLLQDRSIPPPKVDADNGDARSDSEMSVVLDPTPQKGRSSSTRVPPPKKTKGSKAPAKKGRAKKADTNTDAKLDPEQEQLKSLKAWLLKCGIRRIWARELAKFETPREQIAHLKGILTDIGMTGRYSAEKAKKIKAKRELKAELEAIQANAESWGMEEKGNVEEVGRPRRRIGGRKARAVVEDDEEEGQEEGDGEKLVKAREREVEDLAFMDGQSESE